ncbi:hypothetical protein [Streptomyces sp. NBC_01451]|uniref:hypothetical protein n=1 Tax=Streptomyces sp. NBC_01451 TaxID=2903872 RepID=UPI002E3491D8|nr:hypothetical protein [Streptomyces sp. NBC_01451]
MAGTLLALISLAVVAYLAVQGIEAEPEMDQRSYEHGYHAFAGSYVVTDEERAADEARCEELWGAFPSDELAGLKKDDWVAGCADYIERKDSRF